jgi:hypothetical protein
MATPWAQVANSPQYKALPPDQQEAARQQYFAQVVAPQVPPDQQQAAKAQFDAQTSARAPRATDAQAGVGQWVDSKGQPQTGADPTGTFSENFDAGVGKSFVDTGRGLQQLYAAAADYVAPRQQGIGNLVSGQDNSRSADVQRQIDEQANVDYPLMMTAGGNVGDVSGQVAQLAIPVGDSVKGLSWAGKAAPYLATAAKMGTYASLQPTQTGDSRAVNTAVGTVLGPAGEGLSRAAGKLAQGAISRMEPGARQLAQKAIQAGIPLRLPQLSSNPAVRTVLSQMQRLPFSGAAKRNAAQQEAFNRAVGQTFGASENKITPAVFSDAKTAISNEFERLTSQNDLHATPQLLQQLQAVRATAAKEGSSDAEKMVAAQVDNLLSKTTAGGVIDGKAYQAFDSELGQLIKQGGNPGHHLAKLRDVVRNAMDQSISAKDKTAWTAARRTWAAMKTVEPLVAKSTTGDISPAGLMGRVTADKSGKARMAIGNGGQLGDLARIGQRFLKESPNSGTADRLLVNAGITGGLYGAQHEGYISPTHAAELGALLLANRGGLAALNSRALAEGGSRTLNGLARLSKPLPQLLPTTVRVLSKKKGG